MEITTAAVANFEDALWVVQAWDAKGREYTLGDATYPIRPLPFERAAAVVKRVKLAGKINPDLWSMRAPYGTDAWLEDGMEDRQIEDEKFGY